MLFLQRWKSKKQPRLFLHFSCRTTSVSGTVNIKNVTRGYLLDLFRNKSIVFHPISDRRVENRGPHLILSKPFAA